MGHGNRHGNHGGNAAATLPPPNDPSFMGQPGNPAYDINFGRDFIGGMPRASVEQASAGLNSDAQYRAAGWKFGPTPTGGWALISPDGTQVAQNGQVTPISALLNAPMEQHGAAAGNRAAFFAAHPNLVGQTQAVDASLRHPQQANAEGLGSGKVNPTGGGFDNAPPPAYYPPRPPVGGGGTSLGPGGFAQDTNPTPFSPPPMRYPPVRGGRDPRWAAAVTGMTGSWSGGSMPPDYGGGWTDWIANEKNMGNRGGYLLGGGVSAGPGGYGPGPVTATIGPDGRPIVGHGGYPGGGYEPPGSGNGFGQSNGASGGKVIPKVIMMQTPMLGPPPTAPGPVSGKVVGSGGGGVGLGPVAPTPFGTRTPSNPGSVSPGSYTPPQKVAPTHQWGTSPYAPGGPSGAPPGSGNGYGQGSSRMPQSQPTPFRPPVRTGGGFTMDPYARNGHGQAGNTYNW